MSLHHLPFVVTLVARESVCSKSVSWQDHSGPVRTRCDIFQDADLAIVVMLPCIQLQCGTVAVEEPSRDRQAPVQRAEVGKQIAESYRSRHLQALSPRIQALCLQLGALYRRLGDPWKALDSYSSQLKLYCTAT